MHDCIHFIVAKQFDLWLFLALYNAYDPQSFCKTLIESHCILISTKHNIDAAAISAIGTKKA